MEEAAKLPAGYRFSPRDHSLLIDYLRNKVENRPLPSDKVKEVNLYNYSPECLTGQYELDEDDDREWYFFTPRDKKYANGCRPNRAAGNGYWKATGADKKIFYKGNLVGYKKSLVFYEGKPPCGIKKNWMMHEYRLDCKKPNPNKEKSRLKAKVHVDMKLDEWVLCRVYQKPTRASTSRDDGEASTSRAFASRDDAKASTLPNLIPVLQSNEESMTVDGRYNLQINEWNALPFNAQPIQEPVGAFPFIYNNGFQHCNEIPQTFVADDRMAWNNFSTDFQPNFPLYPYHSNPCLAEGSRPLYPYHSNPCLTEESKEFDLSELLKAQEPISFSACQCIMNMDGVNSQSMNIVDDYLMYDQMNDDKGAEGGPGQDFSSVGATNQ